MNRAFVYFRQPESRARTTQGGPAKTRSALRALRSRYGHEQRAQPHCALRGAILRVPALMSEMGLGCVETRRRASAGEETFVQIAARRQKFASKSDLNRPKKNHSRCFSTFCVFTRPRSIATGSGKLQVRQCPQCPAGSNGGAVSRRPIRLWADQR
jgi:hypothetical protein